MFTFLKVQLPGGLAGMVAKRRTTIKHKRKECGYVLEAGHKDWTVNLMVKKGPEEEPGNCDWKWIRFKQHHESEPAARAWLKEYYHFIMRHYAVHCHKD